MSLNRSSDEAIKALQQTKKALVATYQGHIDNKAALIKKQQDLGIAQAAAVKQEQAQIEELQQAHQHKTLQKIQIEAAIQQFIKELEDRIQARQAGLSLCEIDDEIDDERFQQQLDVNATEIAAIKTHLDNAIVKAKDNFSSQEYAARSRQVETEIALLDAKLNQVVEEMKAITNQLLELKNQRDLLREKNLRELLGKRVRQDEDEVKESGDNVKSQDKKPKIQADSTVVVANPDVVNSIEWQQEFVTLQKLCRKSSLEEFRAKIKTAKQVFAVTFPEFLVAKPSLVSAACSTANMPILDELIQIALQLWGSKEHALFKQFIDAPNTEDTSALYQVVQHARYLMNTNKSGIDQCKKIAEILIQNNANPDQTYLRKNSLSLIAISPRQNALPSWQFFLTTTKVQDSTHSNPAQVRSCP